MSFAEFQEWLAVCRARRISDRLEFQDDLGFARGFDARGAMEARRMRRVLTELYKDLTLEHADEEERAAATWQALKDGTF